MKTKILSLSTFRASREKALEHAAGYDELDSRFEGALYALETTLDETFDMVVGSPRRNKAVSSKGAHKLASALETRAADVAEALAAMVAALRSTGR